MFSTLRNRFGIPGVISVIALVFAMIGGAYAASNGGPDKSATASAKKTAKGPRGPRGATGPAGPVGAAGPAGPAGPKGDNGANGTNGADGAKGATGANGQSVKTEAEPPFGNCGDQEGVKLTSVSGVSYVCNGTNGTDGAKGPTGPTGSPWTAGGTLPVGATLTGNYSLLASEATHKTGVVAPIGFPIPLAGPLDEEHVVLAPKGGNPDPVHCPGSVAKPEAASGYLCVYPQTTVGLVTPPFILELEAQAPGASPAGAYVAFEKVTTENAQTFGSWAVTG